MPNHERGEISPGEFARTPVAGYMNASLALYTRLKVWISDLLGPERFYPKQNDLADYAESS